MRVLWTALHAVQQAARAPHCARRAVGDNRPQAAQTIDSTLRHPSISIIEVTVSISPSDGIKQPRTDARTFAKQAAQHRHSPSSCAGDLRHLEQCLSPQGNTDIDNYHVNVAGPVLQNVRDRHARCLAHAAPRAAACARRGADGCSLARPQTKAHGSRGNARSLQRYLQSPFKKDTTRLFPK